MHGQANAKEDAQRHADQRQRVVLSKIRRAGNQHGEDRHRHMGALRDFGANPFEPTLKKAPSPMDQRVTGEQLQQNRKPHERESQGNAEAHARRHVQHAGGKAHKGEHDEQEKRDAAGHTRRLGTDRGKIYLMIKQRDGGERHRDIDPETGPTEKSG